MANIPLQSISFPGLSDKYTIPVVDNTLTQAGAAADAKKTGDEIGAIKNDLTQGTFPVGNAENAEQLTSTVAIEDKTPYLFRTSGGSVDIGDRETVNKIVGGTIVNNQLVNKNSLLATTTVNGITFTNNNDGSITVNGTATQLTGIDIASVTNVPVGHKILVYHGVTGGHWGTYVPLFNYNGTATLDAAFAQPAMLYANTNTTVRLRSQVWSEQAVNFTMLVQLFDITQKLGTSIADYVYNLETATAGAGVAWLKKHFPAQFDAGYQQYDAGSMQSVSGLTEHRMTGFNQWNEQWEIGAYNSADGMKASVNDKIRSKNHIPCFPNTVYCTSSDLQIYFYDNDKKFISWATRTANSTFNTPNNAYYMTFNAFANTGTTYNHDICINFHWDGEKDGTYEPYKTWSYALDDSVVIRGIPKVDANGNLYYDGDEYLPDGTVNRRFGLVDLGTLTWVYDSTNTRFYTGGIKTEIKPVSNNSLVGDMVCSAYIPAAINSMASLDKAIFVDTTGILYVKNSAYSDAAAFKTAMSGVYLVYELATPTTETADPYQATQIVDDFGTEEYVLADGAFPTPVGHDTMYQNNLRAKLEMSPESPDGDGLYVVQQESGENTYVPLASTATIQDILTRLTALENA